jgi:hypothetical protein
MEQLNKIMKHKICPECKQEYIEKRNYSKENSTLYIHEKKKEFFGITTITKSCFIKNETYEQKRITDLH